MPICSCTGALTHDGDSDPVGIVSMVRWAEWHLHAGPRQVFATGISSGAMMTNVLLGDYPDVFAAGSAMSGVAVAANQPRNVAVRLLAAAMRPAPDYVDALARAGSREAVSAAAS
jgi:poly(3-hydroxybutyrate) depolymerase